MKIAVTYDKGEVFQHFGKSQYFKLYTVDVPSGTITAAEVIPTNGSGHGAMAVFLKEHGVDAVICGGIGGGAQLALADAGISLYGGVTGDTNEAVQHLLTGDLQYNPNMRCDHHGHGAGDQDCADDYCGHHHQL